MYPRFLPSAGIPRLPLILLLNACLKISMAATAAIPAEKPKDPFMAFKQYGHEIGRMIQKEFNIRQSVDGAAGGTDANATIKRYSLAVSTADQAYFFKGRYDRSRARLPENIDAWREKPDIANPGPDLANWPNSAFTLPQGRAYIEFEPLSYTAATSGPSPQAGQYGMDFLLRYGLTDDIELRIFGNGPTRTLGNVQAWDFSPLAFDTKVHLWGEQQDIFLPAVGVEAYIQTQWLGNTNTNSGTQPSISFNFDQSLPWEIDFEYNLGCVRTQQHLDGETVNAWELGVQWSLQRDFFDKDIALFIHGYWNTPSLPRVPVNGIQSSTTLTDGSNYNQNVVGAGFIWTLNSRVAVWGQSSAGTNSSSPSLLSNVGFAVAF